MCIACLWLWGNLGKAQEQDVHIYSYVGHVFEKIERNP